MREQPGLYLDPVNQIYAVTRHDDVKAISRDATTFASTEGNRPGMPPEPNSINMDGQVPLRLIGEMLGYPLQDLDQLAGWLDVSSRAAAARTR